MWTHQCVYIMFGTGRGTNASAFVKAGRLFYMVQPSTHMFEHIADVPDYIVDAFPFFSAAIMIEIIISYIKGYQRLKTFYLFTNVTSGMMQQAVKKIVTRPLIWVLYCWTYQNYCLFVLPWNSLLVWFVAFLLADFAHYWFHRASHEINLFWASHQMHHSSEEMNLTTALRQSVVQNTITSFFYVPVALVVPPSIFFLHIQLNTIYQFWVHTEVIRSLGPLEYILNTASHHRVHHGRNPYCIDKNYGGVLIIWDRIFGTFAAEDKTVAYGLVGIQMTTSPWLLQFGHFIDLFKRAYKMESIFDKFGVFFRGPGWLSESEKIGLSEDDMKLPEVEHPIVYRDLIADNDTVEATYVFIHFVIAIILFQQFFDIKTVISQAENYGVLFIIFSSLTVFGYILEKRHFWYHVEFVRCILILFVDGYLTMGGYVNPVLPRFGMIIIRLVYILSLCVLMYLMLNRKKKTAKLN